MVVSWPAHIKDKGALREQFVHVIDVDARDGTIAYFSSERISRSSSSMEARREHEATCNVCIPRNLLCHPIST
jgi:hypothetical protein